MGLAREDFVEHERRPSDPWKGSLVGGLDEWEAMLAEVEAEILAESGDGGELESYRREREQVVQKSALAMPERWPQHLGGRQLSPDRKYLLYKIHGDLPRGIGGNYAVEGLYVADVLRRPVKVWRIEPPVSAAYWHANGRQLVVRAWESWQLDDPHDPQARLGVVPFP